jgi:phospholipid/cholesterol/gamma-HCH transport system permease protein
MGPLLMAVIISGRSGASFTAEIGTMKVRQEIDGLRVMGIDPVDFLVLPRVLGLSLAGPLLTMIADAFGILGGLIVAWTTFNISFANYFSEVKQVITAADFVQGAVKGGIFAALIGLNGCFHGLRTGTAPEDVGVQTTTAVVTGILLIVLSDALMSGVFHVYR